MVGAPAIEAPAAKAIGATFHESIGRLIEALRDAGHDDLARIVEANRDHPFKSPVEDEQKDELLAELCKRNEGELAERVQRGRYTTSQSEMEAWEESDAEQVALGATEAYAVNRERAER